MEKQWQLVKPGGKLIIIYPNFLGINGVIQLLFDPDNLIMHNLSSMVIRNLKQELLMAKINKYKINYNGSFGVWLENINGRSLVLRMFVYILAAFGQIVKILGVNNRFMSPHIVLVAER